MTDNRMMCFLKYINHKRLYKYECFQQYWFRHTERGRRIKSYAHSERNNRCFLVGNGPSLKYSDLERLRENKEISYAANRIYGLYSIIEWRPTYFVCQDSKIMEQINCDLDLIIGSSELTFLAVNKFKYTEKVLNNNNVVPFFLRSYPKEKNSPDVIFDSYQGICEGMSVMVTMAQLAIFMGYKELYFIGVDNNFTVSTKDVMSDQYNYVKGIKQIDNRDLYNAKPEYIEKAFKRLKQEADNNDIKIFNATRGGKLEVFPRVNFDTLF